MTKELADSVGLVEGEKALYFPFYCNHGVRPQTVTIKEVTMDYKDFIIVNVKFEFDDDLHTVDVSELITKKEVLKMLE